MTKIEKRRYKTLNRPIRDNIIETVRKILPTRESPEHSIFIAELFQNFKED